MEHDFIIKPCSKKSLLYFLKLYTDRNKEYKRRQTPPMTELRLRRFNFDELFTYVKAFAEAYKIILKWQYKDSKEKKMRDQFDKLEIYKLENIFKPELDKEVRHICGTTWHYFYIRQNTWNEDPNSYISHPSLEVKEKYLKAIEDTQEEFYKALRKYEDVIIRYQEINSYSFNETQIQSLFNLIPDCISDKHEKSNCISWLKNYRCFKGYFNKPSIKSI